MSCLPSSPHLSLPLSLPLLSFLSPISSHHPTSRPTSLFTGPYIHQSSSLSLPKMVTLSKPAMTFVCCVCNTLGTICPKYISDWEPVGMIVSERKMGTHQHKESFPTSWHYGNSFNSLKIPFTRSPFQPNRVRCVPIPFHLHCLLSSCQVSPEPWLLGQLPS